MTTQSKPDRDVIARSGRSLGPDVLNAVSMLYGERQQALAARMPVVAGDLRYGQHTRNRLDLYRDGDDGASRPVLLFVHGGGFVRGDKAVDGLFNANVGRWAAARGMIGAVMNYRLAPDHPWPAGGEDVAAAIAWLREHAPEYGGDGRRIVLAGTSAGSVHIATCLQRHGVPGGVAGAILLSGLYGAEPLDERDRAYIDSPEAEAEFARLGEALAALDLPLFVACAEFDPPRFQAEAIALLGRLLRQRGELPRCQIAAGHNHYSMAMHIGVDDRRLSDALADFIDDVTKTETDA